MRRIYQNQCQGIPFAQLGKLSVTELAGADFYDRFYADRYPSWEALDANWRAVKRRHAEFVASQIAPHATDVLSVGCGIGYMEHLLNPRIRLHAQEIAPSG